jgi:hypothetical protein
LRLTEFFTAPREWAWTCRSARAELGKPLRGFPHAHPESDDYGWRSPFLRYN